MISIIFFSVFHLNVYIFAGLWTVCFQNFQDIHRFYDIRFNGCMWVFEEEYYIIHDYLLPGFYIAVQFFFTLTFTLTLVSALMAAALFRFDRDDDRYLLLLLSNGASLVAACKLRFLIHSYCLKMCKLIDLFIL